MTQHGSAAETPQERRERVRREMVEALGDDEYIDELVDAVMESDVPARDPDELRVDMRAAAPWTVDEVVARLQERPWSGIHVLGGCGLKSRNLEFLGGFPRLRSVAVDIAVKDDTAAFGLPELESLTLVTASKVPVPECRLEQLRFLCLTERVGMEMRKWPDLEVLRLGQWRSEGVTFLAGGDRLQFVELEGKRQRVTLEGIEGCSQLETLQTVDAAVEDLAPLRGLSQLRELKLVSRLNPHGSLDLRDITSPVLEKLCLGSAHELRHLDSLADLPALRELRLVDCTLTDDDRATLSGLQERVEVTIL